MTRRGQSGAAPVGRLLGVRVLKRLPPGTKRRAAHDWFVRELDARSGFILVTTLRAVLPSPPRRELGAIS